MTLHQWLLNLSKNEKKTAKAAPPMSNVTFEKTAWFAIIKSTLESEMRE